MRGSGRERKNSLKRQATSCGLASSGISTSSPSSNCLRIFKEKREGEGGEREEGGERGGGRRE